MRKNFLLKITVISILIILLLNVIYPNKVYADTSSTVLDTLILEPVLEIFTFVVDSIMSVFSGIMTQDDIQFVMKDNPINDTTNVGSNIVIDNVDAYKNSFGNLKIKYPRFTYSPEEIFSNNIDLLDINFISGENGNQDWKQIRSVISSWYKALRIFAIIGLLSVLIYTGIKIIISSTAQDKAKYKERIINWFIAFALLFAMHYIMAFILILIGEICSLFGEINGVISVNIDGTQFTTNLIGLARFQMQQEPFSVKLSYFIIYVALVVFTFKFTMLYFKRMLSMAFLTLIAPIVALMYPIDKMDGKAQGFELWLKEYIYNALLQPMHYLLYYILVSSSLTLAAKNPLYAIIALLFLTQAEKLLKKIFGFGRAKGGMVGGIAGAYATGAIASSITGFIRDPLHRGKKSKGSSKSEGKSKKDEEEIPYNILKDTDVESSFAVAMVGSEITDEEVVDLENRNVPNRNNTESDNQSTNQNVNNSSSDGDNNIDIDKTVEEYRNMLKKLIQDYPKLTFYDGDNRDLNALFDQIIENQEKLKELGYSDEEIQKINDEIFRDKNILKNRILANEYPFFANQIPLQYIDNDSRSNEQISNDILKNLEMSKDLKYTDSERKGYLQNANNDMELLNRRMLENMYITQSGDNRNKSTQDNVVPNDTTQENQVKDKEKSPNMLNNIRNARVTRGLANVGKTIVKPVWDTDKSVKYNGGRLLKNVAKGAAGFAVGTTAAAVQAGISITDGKYNVMEGVTSFAAGATGGAKMVEAATGMKNPLKEQETIQEYSKRWYDRDDVINNYNEEYGIQAKEMRKRARDEYVTRGIIDFEEQKQVMKFADHLIKEGKSQKDADRIAVQTLQYKQTLVEEKNYAMLFDKERRTEYLKSIEENYTGTASKLAIRNKHNECIENVIKFDKING